MNVYKILFLIFALKSLLFGSYAYLGQDFMTFTRPVGDWNLAYTSVCESGTSFGIPTGWHIASATRTQEVAQYAGFGTHVLVSSDGTSYSSINHTLNGGELFNTASLSVSGTLYGTSTCSLAVLLEKDGVEGYTLYKPFMKAINFTYSTPIGSSAKTFDWLTESNATGNGTITATQSSAPSQGTIAISGNNVTYTPSSTASGTDSFSLLLTDSILNKTIIVSVTGIIQATPTASNFTYATAIGNVAKTFDWKTLSSAISPSGSTLSATVLTQGTLGNAVISGNNLTYTPNPASLGNDSFTIRISDTNSLYVDVTISVTGITRQIVTLPISVNISNYPPFHLSLASVTLIDMTNNNTIETNTTFSNALAGFTTQVEYGTTKYFAIKLIDTQGRSWYYNDTNITLVADAPTIGSSEFNSTYSFALNQNTTTKTANLSSTKWSDYLAFINSIDVNITNVNLSTNNVTSFRAFGVNTNTDSNISMTSIANGSNNFRIPLSKMNQSMYYGFEVNITDSAGKKHDWFYNFSDGYLYPEHLATVDFKKELNLTSRTFVIDMNKTKPYKLYGNILSNENAIQSLRLIDTTAPSDTFTLPIGSNYTFKVEKSSTYKMELNSSSGVIWYYDFTTNQVTQSPNTSTVAINSTNQMVNLDLNLSTLRFIVNKTISFPIFSLNSKNLTNIELIDLTTNTTIQNSSFSKALSMFQTTYKMSTNQYFAIKLTTDNNQSWIYGNSIISKLSNVNFTSSDFNSTYRYTLSPTINTMALDLDDSRWEGYVAPSITPTTDVNSTSSINIQNENIQAVTNPDGSQTIQMSNDSGAFVATLSKDGTINATTAVESPTGEIIQTELKFGNGTKVDVSKSGEVSFSMPLSSGTSLSLTPKNDGSGVTSSVKLANGKAIDIAVPSGAKVTMDANGLKQEFETKEGKTNVTFTPDGKMNVSIQSSDGKSISINSTVEAEISVNQDGSITQTMNLGEMVATVVASKRAEIKGSFESKDGSTTDVNAPKGSNVSASESGVIVSSNDSSYSTNLDVKTDGSVNIEIGSKARADRESIKYSSRAGASDIKAKVLFPNQTSLRRVGASGRAEVEYSMRGAIANTINRSESSITITPKEKIAVKETIGFDGESLIETNGEANLNGRIGSDRTINLDGVNSVSLDSSSKIVSKKHYSNRIFDVITENRATRKTYSSRNFEFKADYYGGISLRLSLDDESRALSSRESFSYSPRRDLSNLKMEFLESQSRAIQREGVALTYSSPRRLIFETIQRDNSNIEIIPNSDAVFQENIYIDMNRSIQLISGSSQIVINGETQEMAKNREYELPMDLETDNSYQASDSNITLPMKKGWNLIGSPITSDITDPFIFGNFDTIWLYDGGTWYKNPDSISYHLGFWVKSNEPNDVNFSGTTYQSDLTSFSEGWSLIAVGDGFESNKTLKDYHIESAWKYENQTYTEIKSLDSLTQGNGVWIKRERPTATLSIKKDWNLKAPPTIEDISDTSIFKDFSFIYTYRDSKWVENPSSIKSGEGFWIYSYVAQELPFYSQTYDANLSDLNGTTWSLKGGHIENANSTGREIWLYRYKSWFSNKLNNLTTVNSGDGFFVK